MGVLIRTLTRNPVENAPYFTLGEIVPFQVVQHDSLLRTGIHPTLPPPTRTYPVWLDQLELFKQVIMTDLLFTIPGIHRTHHKKILINEKLLEAGIVYFHWTGLLPAQTLSVEVSCQLKKKLMSNRCKTYFIWKKQMINQYVMKQIRIKFLQNEKLF